MDLNPQIPEWTSEGGPFEIADYCLEKKSNILVLLNAWLDSKKEPEDERDWSTLNYWAVRTRPLWTDGERDSTSSDSNDSSPPRTQSVLDNEGHETIVVVCNRSGEENGMLFSCMLSSFCGCSANVSVFQVTYLQVHLPFIACRRELADRNCLTPWNGVRKIFAYGTLKSARQPIHKHISNKNTVHCARC